MMSRVCLRLLVIAATLCLVALPAAAQAAARPEGWTEASHGNGAPIDYQRILPDERFNELFISFSPEAWQAEEEDMREIYGERGEGERGLPGAGRGGARGLPNMAALAEALGRSEEQARSALALLPDFAAMAEALEMEMAELMAAMGGLAGFPAGGPGGLPGAGADGEGPPGRGRGFPAGGPGAGDFERGMELARNPIWVPVTIQFGDEIWREVGFRYKGNSTLAMGWGTGKRDLPFKLDFDEFEDEHPELRNQRFYGFKQLTFSRSDFDPSHQREKVTADIFRAAGVPAPQTAFYAVYVDAGAGDGFEFWGIYTAIELPDDTLIESQFASDNGNMYKPSGSGASFRAGSFNEDSFDKETNRDGGYDDILALFDALHADTRLSDPARWRSQLASVFNIEVFLRWLAANTLAQNWDTYGRMAHNYYLYADEATGQLTWIPWDNNMALGSSMGLRAPLSLDLNEVEADAWPLIGYLLAQPADAQRYHELLAEFSAEVFTPAAMSAIYESNYELLSGYLRAKDADADLEPLRAATDELIAHAQERAIAAQTYLESRG